MINAVRPLILRVLKVPEAPATQRERVQVFRASRNFYRYNLLRWGLGQALALALVVAGVLFLRALPDTVPQRAIDWVRVGEAVAAVLFLGQLPVTFAMLRLDFELRWYIVGERSLRIREGLLRVREQTMTFANVQNMAIRQGPLQRLLGIADLEVHTAGGGAGIAKGQGAAQGGDRMHVGTFRGVDDAHRIRDAIRDRVRLYRSAGLGDPDDDESLEAHGDAAPPDDSPLLAARAVLGEVRALRAAVEVGA